MNANPAFLALPLLFLACADTNRNLAACDALRHNHERIAEIESSLAKLETEPPSEKRDLRKADLERRRRMFLIDNDRQQPYCHPIGEEHAPDPYFTDPRHP